MFLPRNVSCRTHVICYVSHMQCVMSHTLSHTHTGGRAVMQQYTSVLECLLRLRQACSSGSIVPAQRLARARQVLQQLTGTPNMYLCIYVCICIHTYKYICIHIYVYVYIYIYMCVCVYIYIYAYIHTHSLLSSRNSSG